MSKRGQTHNKRQAPRQRFWEQTFKVEASGWQITPQQLPGKKWAVFADSRPGNLCILLFGTTTSDVLTRLSSSSSSSTNFNFFSSHEGKCQKSNIWLFKRVHLCPKVNLKNDWSVLSPSQDGCHTTPFTCSWAASKKKTTENAAFRYK